MELGRIDRLNDRPPYRQIADHLRAAIDAGQLGPGDRLPSEAELKQHYGVARMTARQAIQELRAEGRVVAEHGRGLFVRQPPPARQLASDRFARKHREAGKAAFLAEAVLPRVDQIEVTQVEAPASVRERLQLEDRIVLNRSRRYFADDRPVAGGGPERTLAAHRRRPDGYCTGCVHTLAHWPCTVARIALSAVAGRN